MKCCKQCLYAFNKATRVLGMIKRIKKTIRFKDFRVMLSLYKTLVRPHVEYCSSAWNPHYIKDKQLIAKVQRRFTRMIYACNTIFYCYFNTKFIKWHILIIYAQHTVKCRAINGH